MIRLEKSEALNREIRADDAEELGILTSDVVAQAIREGRLEDALRFLEYFRVESERNNDAMTGFVDGVLTRLAGFGEEEVEKIMRERYSSRMKQWIDATPGVEETLQRCLELKRGHIGATRVVEEEDRYVVIDDPCGSGGRLRRNKDVAVTSKAYPWSWSRSGIPYYCVHCCLMWEIIPTELRGYPLRINLVPERPEEPCVQLFYKKPELIPEEYFTRIGMSKNIK